MIKDELRELRVRLDQMERIALAIPTEYWPNAFDAVLESWEPVVGGAPALDEAEYAEAPPRPDGRLPRLTRTGGALERDNKNSMPTLRAAFVVMIGLSVRLPEALVE